MDRFRILELIGEGTYGKVFKAQCRETGIVVAIKRFKQNEDEDPHVRKTMAREIKVLRDYPHANIVPMREHFRENGKLYLIFDYIDHTLLEELQVVATEASAPAGLSPDKIKLFVFQMLCAIEFLHRSRILHRDIKPENLLLSRNGVLKLCDFGFARGIRDDPKFNYTDYVSTRWYRAPELLVGDAAYTSSIDIWALGCIFAEVYNGMPLFPGDSDLHTLQLILETITADDLQRGEPQLQELSKKQRVAFKMNSTFDGLKVPSAANALSAPEHAEEVCLATLLKGIAPLQLDFLRQCLVIDGAKRASAEQLLQHEYFDEDFKRRFESEFGTLVTLDEEYELDQTRVKLRAKDDRSEIPLDELLSDEGEVEEDLDEDDDDIDDDDEECGAGLRLRDSDRDHSLSSRRQFLKQCVGHSQPKNAFTLDEGADHAQKPAFTRTDSLQNHQNDTGVAEDPQPRVEPQAPGENQATQNATEVAQDCQPQHTKEDLTHHETPLQAAQSNELSQLQNAKQKDVDPSDSNVRAPSGHNQRSAPKKDLTNSVQSQKEETDSMILLPKHQDDELLVARVQESTPSDRMMTTDKKDFIAETPQKEKFEQLSDGPLDLQVAELQLPVSSQAVGNADIDEEMNESGSSSRQSQRRLQQRRRDLSYESPRKVRRPSGAVALLEFSPAHSLSKMNPQVKAAGASNASSQSSKAAGDTVLQAQSGGRIHSRSRRQVQSKISATHTPSIETFAPIPMSQQSGGDRSQMFHAGCGSSGVEFARHQAGLVHSLTAKEPGGSSLPSPKQVSKNGRGEGGLSKRIAKVNITFAKKQSYLDPQTTFIQSQSKNGFGLSLIAPLPEHLSQSISKAVPNQLVNGQLIQGTNSHPYYFGSKQSPQIPFMNRRLKNSKFLNQTSRDASGATPAIYGGSSSQGSSYFANGAAPPAGAHLVHGTTFVALQSSNRVYDFTSKPADLPTLGAYTSQNQQPYAPPSFKRQPQQYPKFSTNSTQSLTRIDLAQGLAGNNKLFAPMVMQPIKPTALPKLLEEGPVPGAKPAAVYADESGGFIKRASVIITGEHHQAAPSTKSQINTYKPVQKAYTHPNSFDAPQASQEYSNAQSFPKRSISYKLRNQQAYASKKHTADEGASVGVIVLPQVRINPTPYFESPAQPQAQQSGMSLSPVKMQNKSYTMLKQKQQASSKVRGLGVQPYALPATSAFTSSSLYVYSDSRNQANRADHSQGSNLHQKPQPGASLVENSYNRKNAKRTVCSKLNSEQLRQTGSSSINEFTRANGAPLPNEQLQQAKNQTSLSSLSPIKLTSVARAGAGVVAFAPPRDSNALTYVRRQKSPRSLRKPQLTGLAASNQLQQGKVFSNGSFLGNGVLASHVMNQARVVKQN